MDEKELIARGAECIGGDLILNRKTVGEYRQGRFVITSAGLDALGAVAAAETKPAKVEKVEKVEKPPKQAKQAKVENPPDDTITKPLDLDSLLDD